MVMKNNNYPAHVYVAEYEYYLNGEYNDSYYVYLEGATSLDHAKELEEYFRPDDFNPPDKMHRIKVRSADHLRAIIMVCDRSGNR